MKAIYRNTILLVGLLALGGTLGAQQFETASAYFSKVSQNYESVVDYQARVSITQGKTVMTGDLFFKQPNLVRINFTKPENQVISVDGRNLRIYIPAQRVCMTQALHSADPNLTQNLTPQGLSLLRQNYSVAYLTGPNAVPLEDGSDERVVKLKLNWRNAGQGFRTIVISVDGALRIRRMVGTTVEMEQIQYDFKNIKFNQGIPETRFEYSAPPEAFEIPNFLFDPNE